MIYISQYLALLLLKSFKFAWNSKKFLRLIMKFVLKLSLEHMALVQNAIFLWNQNEVRILIIKHSSENLYSRKNWKTIEERVIEDVLQLSLPQLLKEKIVGLIRPIGLEILEWMQYHDRYNTGMKLNHTCLRIHLPAEFCWTPQGTVDRKKTAQVIIKDEYLNVVTCYILACDSCLQDDIIQCWRDMPEYVKYYDWKNFSIISFWSDKMRRGEARHISNRDVFQKSVREGNKVAAKYFLQKLTLQEREKCLEYLTMYAAGTDVLCFLLPAMEEEEQMLVFKSDPYGVLRCFLQWPWQSFFMEVANCSWSFLSKDNYDEILRDIIGKVRDGYKDYNYQKLFGEFWQKSPSALKESLIYINEIDKTGLTLLFDIKDKENIRLILKDLTLAEKEELIYSDEIDDYLTHSVWANEWDFLEFIIRECLPSKDEMLKFKEEFEKRSPYTKEHLEKNKDKWSEIFCFSGDSIYKINKRSVEESENSSSKRFQSLE